jgi:hypothetical protein
MTSYKPPAMKKKKWGADRTMINIKRSTKSELEKIGDMRDSFDSVIAKLIQFWNENH